MNENENKESKSNGAILWFVAGGIVGALFALLYAPKSGKELRREIKEKTSDLKDEVDDIIKVGKKNSSKFVSVAKKKAKTILTDAEKILNNTKEKSKKI